ncbi:MAG: DUF4276 family protein [Deltaproteobacteria bacterium]|jgi:Domain of unknown function (DUF4276)
MKVIIYVEGPSDKAAMEALLRSLVEWKRKQGISIEFFDAPSGDKKTSVLAKVPIKAVNMIMNDPSAVVIALPDLYPKNKAFPHVTFNEMSAGIRERFHKALKQKGCADDVRLQKRFQVFCFKHDLEVLLLAAEDALKERLGVTTLKRTWKLPVEEQDHDWPPKRVVENLFKQHDMRYKDTVDTPAILAGCDYNALALRCPQCFKPFIDFLEGLQISA